MNPKQSDLDEELKRLVDEAWQQYEKFQSSLAQRSMPIIFFGALEAYKNSQPKVVTVGLNPAFNEFPANNPSLRFPSVSDWLVKGTIPPVAPYIQSLIEYFDRVPYWAWFNSLEPVLQGMDVSFEKDKSGVALHIDLCSPLATDPAWGGLQWEDKINIEKCGTLLWHKLIQYLKPDIIIASFARDYLKKIKFNAPAEFYELAKFVNDKYDQKRKNPYIVEALHKPFPDVTLFVYGPAAQTPFGLIDTKKKYELGYLIKKEYQSLRCPETPVKTV